MSARIDIPSGRHRRPNIPSTKARWFCTRDGSSLTRTAAMRAASVSRVIAPRTSAEKAAGQRVAPRAAMKASISSSSAARSMPRASTAQRRVFQDLVGLSEIVYRVLCYTASDRCLFGGKT